MTRTAPVLITGAAGFIGFHLARHLLAENKTVTGIDNINDYYDPALKEARLKSLKAPNFRFTRLDLTDAEALDNLVKTEKPEIIIHLAAQAGVRYSIENPGAYHHNNLTGFFHILEVCRKHKIRHLIYASSSSVYGASADYPYAETQPVNHPVSFYAATKKANEAMAHAYAHLYGLPCTGLRFFTVYGPWGRPDMALWRFTQRIFAGEPIPIYGQGEMSRDFTYCDDVVKAIIRLMALPPEPNPEWNAKKQNQMDSSAPWRILNIGNDQPVDLERFIRVLEDAIGIKAIRDYLPMQPGDIRHTAADISAIRKLVGFAPSTPIETGIAAFVDWYRAYHNNRQHSR